MGYALVFSGQGQQHAGMLPWLADGAGMAPLLAELAQQGRGWRDPLSDPDLVRNNLQAQRLLTATACTAWAQLQNELPPPAIIAGYSVGELAAFAAAGVFSPWQALQLASSRAACMDQAGDGVETGLLGVTGSSADGLALLCRRFDLEVAIRIDPGSAVLGGLRSTLEAAAELGNASGWRCTALNVSLASHTRWMQVAVPCFEQALAGVTLQRPARPLLSNALGRVRSHGEARIALARQIAQTVRWDECMEMIAAQRVQAVLEIGPGQALARLWNERHADVPARSVDEFRSAAAIVKWVARAAGRPG